MEGGERCWSRGPKPPLCADNNVLRNAMFPESSGPDTKGLQALPAPLSELLLPSALMRGVLGGGHGSPTCWLCSQQALMRHLESSEVTGTRGLGGGTIKAGASSWLGRAS